MIDPFYIKMLLCFIVGGLWVTVASVVSEKFGSNIGGLLGGFPSTVVIAMFFIAWTQGSEQAFHTTTAFPLAFAFNAVFLISYSIFVQRGLIIGILISVFIWGVLQSLLFISHIESFFSAIIGWGIILVISYYILSEKLRIKDCFKLSSHINSVQIAWRAIFSGTIVVLAVFLSRIGGPLLGTIFSAFPSVYLSTLIIGYQSGGVNFSRSLVAPLMISGLVNCIVFVTIFRFVVLHLPLFGSIAIAYGLSIISTYCTYKLISTNN